jgi:hypothetical protein
MFYEVCSVVVGKECRWLVCDASIYVSKVMTIG